MLTNFRLAPRVALGWVILLAAGSAAFAEAIPDPSGRVAVIDGDTFRVGGVKVRLFGIDAPERDEVCLDAQGRGWKCGQAATARARALWQGRQARCEGVDVDRYGRIVARCLIGGEDAAARLVREGLARAFLRYSRDYVDEEKVAVAARRGIWQGPAAAARSRPADPPQADQTAAEAAAAGGCRIKGNISRSGERIYHLPGQRDYARTRISPARGERWFCSEAEAIAAGWRRARR